MTDDRTSARDAAQWCLAAIMALALFLLAPRLSANNTGRVVTVVLSAAILAFSIHPTLHSPWLHSNVSRRIVLCFLATGIAAFGSVLWPYSLSVTPSNVRFSDTAKSPGQTYSFRFTNRSDKDLYAPQLKFRIHSQTMSEKDFQINIPAAGRRAYAEGTGEKHFADIQGLVCRDSYRRPLFSLFVAHLAPRESREITITNGKVGSAKVGATTGFFSTTPLPFNLNANSASVSLGSDEPLGDCQSFGFLVDAHEHEGMYWFSHEGGKLDGKIVQQD